MFIKKLNFVSDSDRILNELHTILEHPEAGSIWASKNQVGINSRPASTEPWSDGVGSLLKNSSDYGTLRASESDFTVWNLDEDSYLRQQVVGMAAATGFTPGRVRIMRLKPKTGLRLHPDTEERYHLVLQTNFQAMIGHHVREDFTERSDLPSLGIVYRIPKDNTWYKVDTTEVHWVYNGGNEDRIHVVVSGEFRKDFFDPANVAKRSSVMDW